MKRSSGPIPHVIRFYEAHPGVTGIDAIHIFGKVGRYEFGIVVNRLVVAIASFARRPICLGRGKRRDM
jgi:hypothetical protein